MELESSYRAAESISRASGSSFYRSFDFLKRDRRRAMHALYAFARLLDNATDDPNATPEWHCESWLRWVEQLASSSSPSESLPPLPHEIEFIRSAMADSVQRYRIPAEMLSELIRGVDMDAQGIAIQSWYDLEAYSFRVASTIGICCLSIWTDGKTLAPTSPTWQSAVDCGIAFQLTNILRDLREDALRGRIYLPQEDLTRFGVDPTTWLAALRFESQSHLDVPRSWIDLVRIQCERASALFDRGWQIQDQLEPDSFRMFSLMWHTYRQLLAKIEKAPETVFVARTRLTAANKSRLAVCHFFTPMLARHGENRQKRNPNHKQISAPKLERRPPQVAVIGAGLAGMNASLHLARHGCQVTLFEAKTRLGGRAGSFTDYATGLPVDYCQHVGMQCCKELRRWIDLTQSRASWRNEDVLHFVSKRGKRIAIRGWPLPAPFHLSGLLLGWPDLTIADRARVGLGLVSLLSSRNTEQFQRMPALRWLEQHFQNNRTIANFWATILVSALGEQIDRVAMGPVKKVLADGFAATRDAYHLLVPTIPLAQWMEHANRKALQAMRVDVRCASAVSSLQRDKTGRWEIHSTNHAMFDSVVIAVPWHRIQSLLSNVDLPPDLKEKIAATRSLESSPITGVHTWWDRPWLEQPHAILIDRLCQWVFPGPESSGTTNSSNETYYQIVISGSRQLPKGNSEAILEFVRADLAEVFPESARSTLLRGKVVTDPQSVFSVSPGHEASRLSSNALASEGIFLGGDWTDTGWPATMEGALRSGLLASEGALAYLGRAARLLLD